MRGKNAIVVVGGGFAGIRAALDLDRQFGHDLDSPIFLIDPSPYHLYTPTLFKVASDFVPKAMLIPYKDIFRGTNIHHIQEKVTHIDVDLQQVITSRRRISYKDVVIALGSQSHHVNDKKREGESILACSTIDDLLVIRQRIDHCFRVVRNFTNKECHNHFVVVGGGPTGVEFAVGLHEFIQEEAKRYNLSAHGIHITLVEGREQILAGFPHEMVTKVNRFIKSQGITVRLQTQMSWKGTKRLMMDQESLPLKTVVWAAGVNSHSLVRQAKGLRHDEKGRVLVDASLQAIDAPGVWVVGDSAAVDDAGMAMAAVAHGAHVAKSIMAVRQNRSAPAYHKKTYPFVLQLTTKYGVAKIGNTLLEGIVAIWYKRWFDLRYLLSILPLHSAYQYWISGGTPLEGDRHLCSDCHVKEATS